MTREELIERITQEVIRTLKDLESSGGASVPSEDVRPLVEGTLLDLTQEEYKDLIQLDDPVNPLALRAMERATTARIGIGRSGERLTTKALLSLRADHAMAKDAVLKAVDESLLADLDLHVVQSKCQDIDEHLTRPDLGRQLSDEGAAWIKDHCLANPQVQVYVSDGLSNAAIENNIRDCLPILLDGLKDKGLRVGTPFFVKYGRVPTLDAVSELTGAEVTCVLIGERPGLAASDSMSAYITYGAHVGILESKRTVVSNIHKNGIQPVEAGAYLVDLLEKVFTEKKSGVDLKL